MLATAGMMMGRIGMIRSHQRRDGSMVAAHASPVPSTSAIASEPSASSTVVATVCQMPVFVNASE